MTTAKPSPPEKPCPHCRRPLSAVQRGKHCPPTNNTPHPTCTWIRCACQAVIDLHTNNHTHPSHAGPPAEWKCAKKVTA